MASESLQNRHKRQIYLRKENLSYFISKLWHTPRILSLGSLWEELVLRIQNGGLTTQHDTEKCHESFLIWPIFDRNITFKWVIVSIFHLISCFFHDLRRSESIRVDLSWSDPDCRSDLIRSDFCTCLYGTLRDTAHCSFFARDNRTDLGWLHSDRQVWREPVINYPSNSIMVQLM